MTRTVLLVDDDAMVREALAQTLQLHGLIPLTAASYIEAKDHIARGFPGVILSDIRMPGKDGFALLARTLEVDADLPVILLTGEGDIPMAVRGMSEGAFGFLEKPCDPAELLAVVEKALRTRALVLENRLLRLQTESGDAAARLLFGISPLAQDLRAKVRKAAKSRAEVLICGEPGSGTAKVADAIHQMSGDAMRSFIKLPAAGLDRSGLVAGLDKARGGTLFLDEVAALDPALQFALLELLEHPTSTRLIAGTCRDLQKEAFNADLFYRLDIIRIRIPSLRERVSDIPILFHHYVATACEQAALPVPEITSDINAHLMAQDWPGNARALMNSAMRFAMGLGLETIDKEGEGRGLTERLAEVERVLLVEALRRHHGAASAAARELKLPRKTFYDKLARHGIRPESFRN
ncbi:MAG: sigma-54-dependent Fis family transcriptional regulator [Rhodobacteraceae bacterium]|nr:sigma-54-dependent Fis family transcriptional regulator [Paracoccaceae bacterium]